MVDILECLVHLGLLIGWGGKQKAIVLGCSKATLK
jgi:hypothetical protein